MTKKINKQFSQELLSYAILVKHNGASIGSGTFIQIKNSVYFITAKHVLFKPNDGTVSQDNLKFKKVEIGFYPQDKNLQKYQEITLNIESIAIDKQIHSNFEEDICGLKIIENIDSKPKLVKGAYGEKNYSLSPIPPILFKNYKEIEIGTDTYLMGYPSSIGIKPNHQFLSNKPLLRKGIIAGKNDKTKSLIADCQVHHGNSGCPVFIAEQTFSTKGSAIQINNGIYFIGIAIQYIPYSNKTTNPPQWLNSGYSVVQPIDMIIKTLEELESVNK